ncbi:forkhead box protein M1-like isoform X2 [Oreochromis aureus]|uniref:forkhead box protein M1-like isoform X2 n=1 Tax=Oreochromis aureus TaxID=47969 RepID=UPI001952FA76|nr:forkhead box protein M1-like isoform X2 [Oreochromis aureus]
MRRSPTRPLILKRRKLPFHQNATDSQPGESGSKEPSKPAATQSFSDGIRIMDHPSMSDTQVVVIPETAEVQSVIGALTAKDNECGAQGPNKLILLSGSGSDNKWDYGPDSQSAAEGAATRSTEGHKVKAETTSSFTDDSLTDLHWLGKMSTCDLEPNSTKQLSSKENQNPLQTFQNKFILLSGSASVNKWDYGFIPETAEVQSVIGALTAKDNECGAQGPNKLILLSGSGSGNKWDYGPDSQSAAEGAATRSTEGHKVKAETTHSFPVNKDVTCNPLDDSLGRMSTCDLEPNSTKQLSSKENQNPLQTFQAHNTHTSADAPQQPISERPPYSYMAMIQFAINSRKNRRMTLKEIYMWIEDNFSYYRDVAKPGWKNSIRHNLSLHDLFIRETSPDGKMSFWTIRHEANRYLTLDHVYKPGRDPMTATVPVPMLLLANQHQKRTLPDARKTPTSSAPCHAFCLSAIHFLLPAEWEQFTSSKESPHSTEGDTK